MRNGAAVSIQDGIANNSWAKTELYNPLTGDHRDIFNSTSEAEEYLHLYLEHVTSRMAVLREKGKKIPAELHYGLAWRIQPVGERDLGLRRRRHAQLPNHNPTRRQKREV